MCDPLTAPAEACAPDADRDGPDASSGVPQCLAHLVARLILLLLRCILAAVPRRAPRVPSWWHDRQDLPPGSAQAEAASVRGSFGNAIAWMCLRHGIGPGHPEWPELSRAIVAFGGSTKGFRAGDPPRGLQWWENPDIFPGMIGMPVKTPAATAVALLLSQQAVADVRPPALNAEPAEAGHARLPASWRRVVGRAGTGPPTGPPAAWDCQPCHARRTGSEHGRPRRPDPCRPQSRAWPDTAGYLSLRGS